MTQSPFSSAHRFGLVSAGCGFGAWVLVAAASMSGYLALGVIEVILALAVLVIVPLGLRLHPTTGRLKSLAVFLQPFAAVLLAVSLRLPKGILAAGLATGWALVCGLFAIDSLLMFMGNRPRSVAETAPPSPDPKKVLASGSHFDLGRISFARRMDKRFVRDSGRLKAHTWRIAASLFASAA